MKRHCEKCKSESVIPHCGGYKCDSCKHKSKHFPPIAEEPNKHIKKMTPISIKVKNFYGDAWLNVVQNAPNDFYVLNKFFFSKEEAVKDFPAIVKKECRKTVKVWLVEAL